MVAAAGNDGRDACRTSPTSAEAAITVGSTTSSDERSSFSNYGSCVDVYAPGSGITSTTPFEDGERPRTWSGTSMSSPHVAGIAAVLRADSVQDLSPVQVKDKIYRNAKFLSEHPRRGQVLLANLVAGGCNAGVTPPTGPSNPPPCSDIINGGQCKGTEGCLWKKGTCVGM